MPEIVSDPARLPELLRESPYMRRHPIPRKVDGSTFYALTGAIMGGGSSVNYMSIARPTRCDLDGWAALGNPDWSYDKLLPIMKRIESDKDYGETPIHGSAGPLHLERSVA